MTKQITKDELTLVHDALIPVLARAAIGSFDSDVEINPVHSERVNELLMGVQVLLEVIRETTAELASANSRLRGSRDRSVNLLDEVLKRSLD
ncbi:MAG: hypothetical protein JWN01_1271 [Patescibacteria group bacterium]|nr:hypothetical protein [Patescibacteria group bacterium]